jgi:hypothetical protein
VSRAIVRTVVAVAAILAACGGDPAATPSPTASPPATPASTEPPTFTPTEEPSPSPEPSPEPEPQPLPTSYAPDAEPNDVPAEALVPEGATVAGHWFAFTDDGVRIVVAWAAPTATDRASRGVAVWRRADTAPHWRAAFVRQRASPASGMDVQATTADVTGDRSDDVLLFEGTGGSGACGTWTLVELLRIRSIYRKRLCDARIEPAPPDRPGLVLTESVFRPGDAHCCPSAIRRTTLLWTGTGWDVADRTTSPT